ncbi:ThiF family adenylyltransferase [Pectobacteriaceae bacterium CE70]|nr:ThiF family adenylyltransferase [Pectobacteriaceae bacterium C52]WJV65507.1 ThiF family adenylyltransferase [Pectobacteriaceae bacterium CE70]WJY09526.1 ThiF family adenylyltransferase [Pectobacteriaceae bacterium C80]
MSLSTVKPLIKESHHIILANDGDICIGEIPGVSQVINDPPAWVRPALEKMDGKRTVPRILKELLNEGIEIESEHLNGLVEGLAERKLLQDNSFFSKLLSGEEVERYNRQILQFSLIDADNQHPFVYQERLKQSKIAIFGMGGWGTWCALQFAMSGIGALRLIDGDDVELSNINRQVLYRTDDVGKNKVDAAKDTILAYNENVNVETYFEFASPDRARLEELIGDSTFIVLAWAALGYYRKDTVEELIHDIAKEKSIPVIELGGDPLEISVGPIYLNDGIQKSFDDVKDAVKNKYYNSDSDIKKFQEARLKHSFIDGDRKVNAWQSAPSLSIMAGIVTDQVVKTITEYDRPHLVGKKFYLSLQDFKVREEEIF